MKPQFHKSFFVAGLLAILMVAVMTIQGAALKTAVTPTGIINLEFARTVSRVDEILKAWKNLNDTALWNTLIDFAFIASYTFFFSKGMQYVTTKPPHNWFSKNKNILLQLTAVPGMLDVVENGFMMGWFLQFIPSFSPALVYWMVWIKFILAGLLLAVCLPAWVFNTYLLLKKNE